MMRSIKNDEPSQMPGGEYQLILTSLSEICFVGIFKKMKKKILKIYKFTIKRAKPQQVKISKTDKKILMIG